MDFKNQENMTAEEFKALKPGDLIRGKSSEQTYIVTANYGERVTAVKTADVTNPQEWDLVTRRHKKKENNG